MALTSIGFTGWDVTVEPREVADFLSRHPKATAGIHFSQERRGQPLHPPAFWVRDMERCFRNLQEETNHVLLLDAHLGNRWSMQVSKGDEAILRAEIPASLYQRIQLNHFSSMDIERFLDLVARYDEQTFILSRSEVTEELCQKVAIAAEEQGVKNIAFLFDSSWGRGQTPEAWPTLLAGQVCGYAGGLGPHNLSAELAKISEQFCGRGGLASKQVGSQMNEKVSRSVEQHYWVDMESRLRTSNNRFSLDFCSECYQQALPFFGQP